MCYRSDHVLSRGLVVFAVLFLSQGRAAIAQLTVSGYFGDGMVLQRNEPIQVWGTATAGAEVRVTFADQKSSAKADDKGEWKAALTGVEASGPFELKAISGPDTRLIKNVMVGDVWLIAGQSNVVLPLTAGKDWPELKKLPPFKAIRVCKLPGNYSFDPTDQYSRSLAWDSLDTGKVGTYLSGVGYHFVRTIQPAIGVTVGLVQASAGGTQIEEWMPEEALKSADPANAQFIVRDKARKEATTNPTAKINPMSSGSGTMFNGTIYPMRYAKWAGVVWYQGEANSRTKADYRLLLKTFIGSWRQVFGQPELPFVIVQLPNFGLPKDDGWMRLQESQMQAANDLGLPLVVTIDQGSKTTIHPPDKSEVGRRAGLAALQHVYKQDVEGTSPFVKTIRFDGDSAVMEFDGFKGDLVLKGEEIKGFELAGEDKNFQPATATLQGRVITVKAAGVPQPKAIRYLWANSPDAVTLYSAAGLPAGPFRLEK